MSEGHFAPRRVRAVCAAAAVLAVTGAVWFTTRGTGSPPMAPAGQPVEKGGATYYPMRAADSPPGQVDGYGLAVSAATADAVKRGKTVAVPGPTGGTIEIRPVEPTPPPPGEKK